MVQRIPTPDPRRLLPPLLGCLPTAFASPLPPPALLPLLTPVLRQRLQYLATASSSDSWLLLLNRDRARAAKLPLLVENLQLEPHPVSGELEIEDVDKIAYQRLDSETLHARLEVKEFDLLPTYLWCMGDEQGSGRGWRLEELRALDDKEDGSRWYASLDEAEEAFRTKPPTRPANSNSSNGLSAQNGTRSAAADDDDDNDDAYWASYDRTPGRTPAKRSPAPAFRRNGTSVHMPTTSDLEYFSRYLMEVQPAMDPYDPDEDQGANGAPGPNSAEKETPRRVGVESPSPQTSWRNSAHIEEPHQPRRPSSSSSSSVKRLEEQAENQTQAEIAIKQHISTDIKSLYRMAKAAGIERSEFERLVRTELEMLPMMDEAL